MKNLELNTEQNIATEHDGGHVLVLAGAGTGKTRTIISRTIHLIGKGIKPERILLLTFTRRAAKEMKDRLKTYLGEQSELIIAGTFHHFSLLIMRRMPKYFGIDEYTIIDRDDQEQVMKLSRTKFVEKSIIFPKAGELTKKYSFARNTNKPIKEYLEKFTEYDDLTREKILEVFKLYDDKKAENHYLDYDDILYRFAKVLNTNAEARNKIKALFDHILVDEMQDTNPLQWLILGALKDPPLLYCVGDDAQSIYAFRGADFKNVHSFKERVPNSTILKLEENYRSTQPTLDLSNWLLSQSGLSYGKKLKAHRGPGILPRLIEFANDFDEADWVGDDIIERHETGFNWSDHMILSRTMHACRTVEAKLIEKKIPYRFIGGTSLLAAAHVKDLLSLVRASISNLDELAWMRYLTLWPQIGDVTAGKIIRELRKYKITEDSFQCLDALNYHDKRLTEAIKEVFHNRGVPQKAISIARDYIEPLIEKKYENWESRKMDLELMVRLAQNHRSIVNYLETYVMDPVHSSIINRSENEDVVTLITIHSAKGTEAKTCYIIKAEPRMFPHIFSLGDADQEEEERRILYVAMTRTMDELIITRVLDYGNLRVWYGSVSGSDSYGNTPYFLENIPRHLITYESHCNDSDVIIPWGQG